MSEENKKTNGTSRHVMSTRLAPDAFQMLEELAIEARRKTGFRVSYSALIESAIRNEYAKLSGPRKRQLQGLLLKQGQSRQ